MSRDRKGILVDEGRQALLRDREKLALFQNDEDIRAIMGTPQGRRFMYRLAYGICKVDGGIWSASAEIHYLEGRRSVGIEVKSEAQRVAPREYVAMIQEQINDAANRQEKRTVITEEESDNG